MCEDFFLRDSNGFVYYRQPEVLDNKQYKWTVTLCSGVYILLMTNSCDYGWSYGSNIVIKIGMQTIGTFSLSGGNSFTYLGLY